MNGPLLVVEDCFQLTGRGLVVMPNVPDNALDGKKPGFVTRVRLVYPDSEEEVVSAWIGYEFFYPRGHRLACMLKDVNKKVPTGTEVWLVDTG